MQRSKTAEEFMQHHAQWAELLEPLRDTLLESGMPEAIKWGVPVYTEGGKNVAMLTAFKNHVAVWFFHGALLKDSAGVLVNAQEGTTQGQRQWRFSQGDDIDRELLQSYLAEARENQAQGRVVKAKKKPALEIPALLQDQLAADAALKTAFESLAPYKQREYADFISGAKQAATRDRRMEKILPMIRQGKGLNDRYR